MLRRITVLGMCAAALILAPLAAPKALLPQAEALCIVIPPIPVIFPTGDTICI